MISDYTTFDDVRAALGVSDEEIDDSTLALDLYSLQLDLAFYEVSPILLATYQALPTTGQTASQLRFGKIFRLYSTFAAAWDVFKTAEMFGYLKVADGRASTERTPKAYQNLAVNLPLQLNRIRALLLAALGELVPGLPVVPLTYPSIISGVGLAVDPVTG